VDVFVGVEVWVCVFFGYVVVCGLVCVVDVGCCVVCGDCDSVFVGF